MPRHRQLSLFGIFLALTALFTAGSAYATTVMITPFKDATLINSSTGFLANGAGPLFAGVAGPSGPGIERALLAFDIASNIPAGSTITSVELQLMVDRAGSQSNAEEYTLHTVEQDWGEGSSSATSGVGVPASAGDSTWLHTFHNSSFWNTPGGDFNATPVASQFVSGLGAHTWGSTAEMVADVQDWLNNPSSNFGWILRGDEQILQTARRFGSREDTSSPPQLIVSFDPVPEPCSLALGLFGSIFCPYFFRSRSYR